MADTVVTVNQGGGADYTVLQTAIDDSDFTGIDRWVIEIEDNARYSENIDVGGSTGTPSATSHIFITAADASYHDGVFEAGARIHPTSSGHTVDITESYVHLNKLNIMISSGSTSSNECIRITGSLTGVVVERCVIDGQETSRSTNDGDGVYYSGVTPTDYTFYNCLFADFGRTAIQHRNSDGSLNMEFCTVYRSSVGEARGGVQIPSGAGNAPTLNLYNMVVAGQVTAGEDDWQQDGSSYTNVASNNASEDTSAPGSAQVHNIVPTDEWTDPANFDFTIKDTDADIYQAGTDRSGSKPDSRVDATIDIVGTTRTATPSIGCFEFASSDVTGSVVQATETDTAQAITPARVVAFAQATETDTAQAITVGSAGQTVAVDQASEGDTAGVVVPARVVVAGQATESDTAQAFTAARRLLFGQSAEADSAQAVAFAKAVSVGLAVETDTAQPIARGALVVTADQATETDTAQAIGVARGVEVGQAVETNLGRIVNAGRFVDVDQATETNTAQAFGVSKGAAVGQAVEADTAQAITKAGATTVGLVAEADTAQPVEPARVLAVAQVSETDTALAVDPAHAAAVEQPLETDTAGVVAPVKRAELGQSIETDTALTIDPALQGVTLVNQAVESDSAQPVAPVRAVTVGQAAETEAALGMTPVRVHPVLTTLETSSAQAIDIAKLVDLGPNAIDVETALPVAAARAIPVDQTTEADSALVVEPIRGAVLVNAASETDSAQPITFQLRRLVGQVVENAIAGSMTPRKTRVVQAVIIGHAPSQLRHWQDEDGRTGRARYHIQIGMPPEVIQALDTWDNGRGGKVLRVLDPITDGMSVDLGSIVDGAAIAGATFSAAQVARNATFSFTATIGATSDGLLLTLGTETAGGVTIGTIANPTRLAVAIGDAVAVEGIALPETGISGLIVLGLSMDEGRLKLWQNGVEVIDVLFAGSTWQDEAAAGGYHRAQADYVNLLAPNAIGAGAADDVTLPGNLMYYDNQLPVSF